MLWAVLSIVGAVIGFIASRKRYEKLDRAERIQLRDYHNPSALYILGIEDTAFAEQYIRFEKDTASSKRLTFKSATIRNDKKLYALQYARDSSLVLVARENDEPTQVSPSYMELWVWRKHVISKE